MEPLTANDPQSIGEFRVHARLGAGGMGQVYLGFSPAGHAVAIKVIHQQFAANQEFLRRFANEVAAASAVGGMYTAPVVSYDLQSATPWLATAYVPGPTLATYIGRHGALPEAALWRLAAGLTEALRAVHAKGLIHRDLKPANVLLADSGPHVIDFGISRAASSLTHLTGTGMAIGTPGYMSPEQAQVLDVGPASDLFSLGCVLAFAATGRPPFDGGNPASVLYKIVAGEPDLAGLTLAGYAEVIRVCLLKDPAQRPTTSQLIAMIGQLGPAAPPTLGSFWAPEVARVIAAEQAAQTPVGLTPPPPSSGPVPAAPGVAGPSAASASGAGASMAAAAVAAASANRYGDAPMMADGYYAAAQRPAPPSTPSFSPTSQPPGSYQPPSAYQPQSAYQPPSAYQAQQPPVPSQQFLGQSPSGPVPPASASFGPNPYAAQAPTGQGSAGQPPWGQAQPYGAPVTPPAGPATPTSQPPYPGQPYPAQPFPGQPYPSARRRPTAAEIPPKIRNAVRCMYAGAGAMALSGIANLVHNAIANGSGAGFVVAGAFIYAIGIGLWLWLANATERGYNWARAVATVLFGFYSLGALASLADNGGDVFVALTTILVWALGLTAFINLWSQQSRAFFAAWGRR